MNWFIHAAASRADNRAIPTARRREKATGMALDITVGRYLGALVTVAPVQGEGWAGGDPGAFRMELWELARRGGGFAGGYGRVREPGHAYDNYRVVFNVRSDGHSNFHSRPGHFNVWLYRALPSEWRAIAAGGRDDAPSNHCAAGSARIGEAGVVSPPAGARPSAG